MAVHTYLITWIRVCTVLCIIHIKILSLTAFFTHEGKHVLGFPQPKSRCIRSTYVFWTNDIIKINFQAVKYHILVSMSHLKCIFEVEMHLTCIKMIRELMQSQIGQCMDFQWDFSRAALYVSVCNHSLRFFRKY